jgi:thiol-disulfide isomerase/thioredoxin
MRLNIIFFILVGIIGCSDSSNDLATDKWNVVNYWAIWCEPCRVEIPELNELSHASNINVLGVNFDGKLGAALSADEVALGIEFPTIADPSPKIGFARPTVLPTTLILSPEGQLVATLNGPQTAQAIRTYIPAQ